MPSIDFDATPYEVNGWMVVALPPTASAKLPSRGQVMVKGTINGLPFQTALEPDGTGSHWLSIDKIMQKSAQIYSGKSVKLSIKSTKDWPEPSIPKDLQSAIDANQQIQPLWARITPMARWEWIRWIASTKNADTRKHRIEVSLSKLNKGERRPCCFNRNMCCVPDVSRNGVLLLPATV